MQPAPMEQQYYKYIHSKAWRSKRLEILERDGHKCVYCGSQIDLRVHHRTYINFGHEPLEDLETACDACHRDGHGMRPVRYGPGESPLHIAATLAEQCPVSVSEVGEDRRPDAYARFIALAAWLQVAMGDRPIMLPCEKVGYQLGLSKMTISIYRTWATEDGYLALVKKHSRANREATEFRFNVGRFDRIGSKAQEGTIESFREIAPNAR
jgi:hypothetical protein